MATPWPTPGVTPSPWGQQLIDAAEDRDAEALAAAKAYTDAHTSKASGAHPATAISYAGGTTLPASSVEAALDTLDVRSQTQVLAAPVDLNSVTSPGAYAHAYHGSNGNVPAPDGGYLFVSRLSSTSVMQVWFQGGNNPRHYVRRYSGSSWSAWGASELVGSGNPNGTVAAPVGTRFVNAEAGGYNGARVWRKDSGIGTAGWVVAEGDTGTRQVTFQGGTITYRRIGSAVTINVAGVVLASGQLNDVTLATIPDGFRPAATSRGLIEIIGVGLFVLAALTDTRLISRGCPASSTLYGGVAYSTVQAWPTVLPGSAA